MLSQELELKQTQRLSPLQIQTIKLIELPVQELDQVVRTELESNPVLDDTPDPEKQGEDEPREVSIDEIKEDDYIPSYRLKVNNWGKDERPEYNTFSVQESLTQSLERQLGFRDLDQHTREVATFIIGSLDESGYLRRSISSLADDMAFKAGIETDDAEVEAALRIIQDMDPAGVGARDVRECLLLQLRASKPTPAVEDAIQILENCFDEFWNKHYQRIAQILDIDIDRIKAARKCIVRLNPAPGGQVDDSYADRTQQIVPDFVLTEADGRLSFEMPRSNIPELRVNRKYAEMLLNAKGSSDREQKEAATFVRQKIDSAKWLIEALKQRHNTLQKTMQAILDYQRDYFADGDDARLRPMILEDIATATGFDISTISRVVGSKYIETPFGVFPLKHFFSEGLKNSAGEEVSTREIRKALQDLVDAEDKTKPLTDEQLVEGLAAKGYVVARRTIAKYRGLLDIPTARMRKEF